MRHQADASVMAIGKLASAAGVTPRTVRFYESLGLLQSAARKARGYRYYAGQELARLKKIESLKAIGLSLVEIGAVLDLYFADPSGLRGKRKVLEILGEHLRDTKQKLRGLRDFERDLEVNIARIGDWIRATESAGRAKTRKAIRS